MKTEEPTRYLLTGGGTGGHVYPAIAIADELRRQDPQARFLYVGVKGKAEETIVPKRGYDLELVSSQGFPGAKPSMALLLFMVSLGWGILKSIFILLRFKPHAIVATGGYVSAPIMFAWILLKKCRLLTSYAFVHEQNVEPGRLNQLVGKMATRVFVTFEDSQTCFPNGEPLGYPIRSEIGGLSKEKSREELQIPSNARVILAFGGSLGARTINRSVVEALPILLQDPDCWVIHGTGRQTGDYNSTQDTQTRFEELQLSDEQKKRYKRFDYLDPIQTYYAASDLIVCRAGAGTLAEVSLSGLPCLFIPKANLPGDHQVLNARELAKNNAARLIYEKIQKTKEGLIEVVEGKILAQEIIELFEQPDKREQLSKNILPYSNSQALPKIVGRIQEFLSGKTPALERAILPESQEVKLSKLSASGLVSYLTRHGKEALSLDQMEYLTYRMYGYLANPAWQIRNIGVKLLGLLQQTKEIPFLLFLLQDKTPASLSHRLLGGDRKQVGFIRRNVLTSLSQCDVWDADIEEAVYQSFEDPYFEVRSSACFLVCQFSSRILAKDRFLLSIQSLLKEKNFEVVAAALQALGELETDSKVLVLLRSFYKHPNWKIRASVLHCMASLVQRKVLTREDVMNDLDDILMTSSGFVPVFSIRKEMLQLSQSLESLSKQSEME